MPDAQPNRPQDLFEGFYRRASRQAEALPWARMAPSPIVVDWLKGFRGSAGDAVIVACGLGDDAEALALHGWAVTAFDIAPTAIEWCLDRFPATTVRYVVGDLFELPPDWMEAFGLVVEVFTIQSLPPEAQPRAMARIASLVAPQGTLLVSAIERPGPAREAGPPWPVSRAELDELTNHGLDLIRLDRAPSSWEGYDLLNLEYRRL